MLRKQNALLGFLTGKSREGNRKGGDEQRERRVEEKRKGGSQR